MPQTRPACASEGLLLVRTEVRALLDLEQHGVLEKAEPVSPADHDHDVTGRELAGGDKLRVIVIDVHLTASASYHQYLRGADDRAFDRHVKMALHGAAGLVHDEAD